MKLYDIPGRGQVPVGTPFELESIRYPANWLQHATPEELADRGIGVEVIPDPPPSPDDVISERRRRLGLGFDFNFGDGRGVHRIGTTDRDMDGWREVTDAAQAAIALGNGSDPLTTIFTETGIAEISAMDWMVILDAARVARQPIWAASFLLQQMDPIPDNYADNAFWE